MYWYILDIVLYKLLALSQLTILKTLRSKWYYCYPLEVKKVKHRAVINLSEDMVLSLRMFLTASIRSPKVRCF